ncbi:hypothetical protein Tsubulata_000715 [Turnera subulata]|uniref:Uncharacterized protein n=1 Tax=Turnera subulata TaxID=218843 RepID=A0A9Q0F6X8_9ROSI|nr:hypothetical protein Tsubulata_000715 [Turnera subulata]
MASAVGRKDMVRKNIATGKHLKRRNQIDRKEEPSSSRVEAELDVTITTIEIFGVKIEKNPPQSKLDELGVTTLSKQFWRHEWDRHGKCTGISPSDQDKREIGQVDWREELNSSPVEAKSDVATTTTEIFGVKIEMNPPRSKLDEFELTTLSNHHV